MTLAGRSLAALLAMSVPLLAPRAAAACGCFAPPTATAPVVQAGERILFSVEGGQVTLHVQIAWSGAAGDFAWLLPLPSLPTLELGASEVFNQLQRATDPVFTLTRTRNCSSGGGSFCAFGGAASSLQRGGLDDADAGTVAGPALLVDTLGPYDFAVLKADDKQAMLAWLNANRYFVPAGTDDAVTPYIHTGAYFLALRLHAGATTGDVQPVVVRYASDLPMIPIVLTSVGAVPHMGILVWLLGPARAIPRNYHHTVLDEAAYDWLTGANYDALIARASDEAPGHHTFVTEYAGPSQPVLKGTLVVPAFNAQSAAKLGDAIDQAHYLRSVFGEPFTGPLKAIVAARVPEPAELVAQGVKADDYFANLASWLDRWRRDFPNAVRPSVDAAAIAADIQSRIIDPLTAAAALFDGPGRTLTRLHTAMSPADMTADPVFDFNATLPMVGNRHDATLETDCNGDATLVTTSGRTFWPAASRPASADALPASQRIEILAATGAPQVVTDNSGSISSSAGAPGCSLGSSRADLGRLLSLLLIVGLALLGARRLAPRA